MNPSINPRGLTLATLAEMWLDEVNAHKPNPCTRKCILTKYVITAPYGKMRLENIGKGVLPNLIAKHYPNKTLRYRTEIATACSVVYRWAINGRLFFGVNPIHPKTAREYALAPDRIVEEFAPVVYIKATMAARRFGMQQADADDVAQETLIDFWQKDYSITDPERGPNGLIWGRAKWNCQVMRRRWRRRSFEPTADKPHTTADAYADDLCCDIRCDEDRREWMILPVVNDALSSIPDKLRDAVLGPDWRDATDAPSVKRTTMEYRRKVGLAKLRETLGVEVQP